MKTTALIDADTLVYAAALSSERAIEWHDHLWTLHSDFDEALVHFNHLLAGIKEATECDDVVMALSDGDSQGRWRVKVLPTYKNNRKKVRRPVVYAPLRQYVHDTFTCYERPTLEGDDVLGILATDNTIITGRKIIVSIDKDLKTIPGELFNYDKPERGVVTVTEEYADYYHLMQALMGDTTDGYSGCPGVGAVSAVKILGAVQDFDGVESAWPKVIKAYAKAGLGEEEALTMARVARILRASDYNFKTKEVILWNPVE